MNKPEFDIDSSLNAFPMHRYKPFKLNYQIVIDVVDSKKLGHNKPYRKYYLWKVTEKNDNINHIEGIEVCENGDLEKAIKELTKDQ